MGYEDVCEVGISEIPLTDSGVRSLTATDKMQKKGVGNCLYVVVEPSKKGGGKSF